MPVYQYSARCRGSGLLVGRTLALSDTQPYRVRRSSRTCGTARKNPPQVEGLSHPSLPPTSIYSNVTNITHLTHSALGGRPGKFTQNASMSRFTVNAPLSISSHQLVTSQLRTAGTHLAGGHSMNSPHIGPSLIRPPDAPSLPRRERR